MYKTILILALITLCCSNNVTKNQANEVKLLIDNFVSENCVSNKECSVKLSNLTSFKWDKLYFFNMSVETDKIAEVINQDFSDNSNYYSRKLIFTNNNEIVHIEKHLILEIDKPIKDKDVDFEIKDSKKYAIYNSNANFQVEIIKTDTGQFYRLRCKNCEK